MMDTEKLSPQGCFDLIERRFENIVLLTGLTENCITSIYFYERYGNIILGESFILIALCGFGKETFPVKIETVNVLKSTDEEIEVPSWDDFMDVKIEQQLKNLKTTVKTKAKSFAYLPPFFTDGLLDLKYHSALNNLDTFIRILKSPVNKAKKDQDFDMLNDLKACHEILVFLWAVVFKPEVISKSYVKNKHAKKEQFEKKNRKWRR